LASLAKVGIVGNLSVDVEVAYHDRVSLQDRRSRIDHRKPRLLWLQVADDLRADIDSGELAPGARLASEAEMAEQYGVSRDTIRRATSELASEGLLVVLHGRGTFVVESA
jgi:DNA-binding GntR family transcriptional regulator